MGVAPGFGFGDCAYKPVVPSPENIAPTKVLRRCVVIPGQTIHHSGARGNNGTPIAVYPFMHDEGGDVRTFTILVRQFFGRFFDNEALSPQADATTNLGPVLGILAVPGAFMVLLLQTLTLTGWGLVTFRYFFVAFSMLAMAFLTVFKWDALFLDRRDYLILTPLPIRSYIVFLAKLTAFGLFLGLFLLDINLLSMLMWPGVDRSGSGVAVMAAHAASCSAAGLFAALSAGLVQGLLLTVLSPGAFRRISAWLQTLFMAVLIMLLFLIPMLGHQAKRLVEMQHPFAQWFPAFWFVGLYEQIRPATKNTALMDLGAFGVQALAWITGLFLLVYLPAYRRNARKMADAPTANPSGPGWLRRRMEALLNTYVLRRPVERAVFHFITQTITRSMKHRVFLAVYGGFGAALAVLGLVSGESGILRLPLMLSFIMVSGLRAAFHVPSELRANWAFQLTEMSDAGDYLAATRKWLVLYAVAPLFLIMLPLEVHWFGVTTALFHAAFGFALSLLLVEILFFGFRKVAFTCSYFPGKSNLIGLGVIYCFGFTFYSRAMAGLQSWLVHLPIAAALTIAALLTATFALSRLRQRDLRVEGALEYEDPGDPEIRSLGLAAR